MNAVHFYWMRAAPAARDSKLLRWTTTARSPRRDCEHPARHAPSTPGPCCGGVSPLRINTGLAPFGGAGSQGTGVRPPGSRAHHQPVSKFFSQ